ncbi:MAG: glycosyltransferase family 2 protein [Gammaproteobacteria bacterium]|nr:glycosyltransferase family 2 protein [Gammaproteobacteria bacterium]
MTFKPIAIIPVYNHHRALPDLCAKLLAQNLPILLVDDGSAQTTRDAIDALIEVHPDRIGLLRLESNQGKGAAVLAGLAMAHDGGYSHALQLDADGQHDPVEAGRLLDAACAQPEALVSGTPAYDHSVPAVRYYGRWITHLLVWLETLSRDLTDSMCGFRVYPLAPALALMRQRKIGARMDFDTDIMVRLYLAGTPVRFCDVSVRYPQGGESRFRMLRDNLRMGWLHLRLLCGLPGLAVRRLLSCARSERSGKHESPP